MMRTDKVIELVSCTTFFQTQCRSEQSGAYRL